MEKKELKNIIEILAIIIIKNKKNKIKISKKEIENKKKKIKSINIIEEKKDIIIYIEEN